MKRTLAYVVTAILLGTVVMLFPVLMLAPSQISTMRGEAPAAPGAHDSIKKAAELEVEAVTVAPFPLSLAYAGFIFMLGFVVALGVSQYYKRRIAQHLPPS